MEDSSFRAIRYFVTNDGPHIRKVGDKLKTSDGVISVSKITLKENQFGRLEYQVWVSNSDGESAIWKVVPYELAEGEKDFMDLLKRAE